MHGKRVSGAVRAARFERLEPHGVGFERTAWRGGGGACCSLVVRRVPAG